MEGLRLCSWKWNTAGGSANPAPGKVRCSSALRVAASFLAPACSLVTGRSPSRVFGEDPTLLNRKKIKGRGGKGNRENFPPTEMRLKLLHLSLL